MAKSKSLVPDKFTPNIIREFALRTSFGFEIEALNTFRQIGFAVTHGGTYSDPVTGVNRQFDILAQMTIGAEMIVLCVECKSVANPVVVSCTRRSIGEDYHTVLEFNPLSQAPLPIRKKNSELYKADIHVGRSIEQWCDRGGKGPDEVWNKFNQATQHAISKLPAVSTLVQKGASYKAIILPCLVVPDGMLWKCKYNSVGELEGQPEACDLISQSLLLPVHYQPTQHHPLYKYSISNIEIMTMSGIVDLWENRLHRSSTWQHIFC